MGDIAERLKLIIIEIAEKSNGKFKVETIEVMPDHVHLFVSSTPAIAAHAIVKMIKGVSSPILRNMFPQLKIMPTLWNHSYYCGTIGNVSESVVRNYIENQKGK